MTSKKYLVSLSGEEWIPILDADREEDHWRVQRVVDTHNHSIQEDISPQTEYRVRTVCHLLGTDILGRDIFSRMMMGINISLIIGFMAILVSLFFGSVMGGLSGYYGGWFDKFFLVLTNSIWSIPTILLIFVFVITMGRGMFNIVLAIGLTLWVEVARLVRGMTIETKSRAFVMSAMALGYSSPRIIIKHVFPNIIDPLIVIGTVHFATAILIEAGISYLGFGVQPPRPSLGQILAENYSYILGGHWYKSIIPALVIFLMVLWLNLSGNVLRDRWDVKMIKQV